MFASQGSSRAKGVSRRRQLTDVIAEPPEGLVLLSPQQTDGLTEVLFSLLRNTAPADVFFIFLSDSPKQQITAHTLPTHHTGIGQIKSA